MSSDNESKKMLAKLFSIGHSLVHTKDFTDIFVDLEEMVLLPWFNAQLNANHLEIALTTVLTSYSTVATNKGYQIYILLTKTTATKYSPRTL